VDHTALRSNWATLDGATPAETAAVVKCDGYGLGLSAIGTSLAEAGCRSFFVAQPGEGVALRAAFDDVGLAEAVIYVLDGPTPGSEAALQAARLTPILNSFPQIERWKAAMSGLGRNKPAAGIHIDTGMNRLGLRLDESAAGAEALKNVPITLVMSHLACAEDKDHALTAAQVQRFREASRHWPGVATSLTNSAGTLALDDEHGALTRPGLALLGVDPACGMLPGGLHPVATLLAQLVQVRWVEPGETVGYAASFKAVEPTRLAVIAAGYGDGLPRLNGSGHYAYANGHRLAFVGRTSMDLATLAATHVPEGELVEGMHIEVFGRHARLEEFAAATGTLPYEMLTGLGLRVRRQHVRRP
jgi:alanine racemase